MNSLHKGARIPNRKLVTMSIVVAIALTGGLIVGNTEPVPQAEPSIGTTVSALSIARHLRSLAENASARTRADTSAESIAGFRSSIEFDAAEIRRQLDLLADGDNAESAPRMRKLLDELMHNAMQLETGRSQFAQSLLESEEKRQKLIAETSWQLQPAAVASEDDLFHRIVFEASLTESQSLQSTGSVSTEDLLLYARLALLKQQIDQGYIALEVATRLTDSQFIGTVEENANLAMYQLRENIAALSGFDGDELDSSLVPLARDLVDAAYGESNLIDLMKTRLRLDGQEARLADTIDMVASSLQREVHAVLENSIEELKLVESERDTATALEAALDVRQHLIAVMSNSSGQTTADTPISNMPEVRENVGAHISGIRDALKALEEAGYAGEVKHLHAEIDRMESITDRILNGRSELSDALQSAAQERARLRSFVDHQLDPAVVASLDNQLYYMLTGRSEFREEGATDSDPLSHTEFLRYWHLASVNDSIFRTFSGLIIAIIMTEATLIGEGEERFITASHRLEKSVDFLEEAGGAEVDSQLVPLAREFIGFGNGESNVFDSLRHRLPLVAMERNLIQANQRIFADLQIDIDALLDTILQSASSSG